MQTAHPLPIPKTHFTHLGPVQSAGMGTGHPRYDLIDITLERSNWAAVLGLHPNATKDLVAI